MLQEDRDFIEAFNLFHLAIATTVHALDQGLYQRDTLPKRFSAALELVVSELEPRLRASARDPYRQLHRDFLEMFEHPSGTS